ncbi:MAG: peptidase [Gemmatimonadetes bacterium]|nr:peptidase [Gemmatimonadota bacterium]
MSTFIRRSARGSVLGLGLLGLAAAPSALHGQYFGQNQVQYQTFDFRVLKTPHFDVYYYPEEEVASRDAARMAERWYARLSRVLDYELEHKQPLILYASHPHAEQTTVIQGGLGEGTEGVTEVFKQRIVIPHQSSYQETDHVVGHELVHAFQYDVSGLGRAGGGLEAASARFQVPLWFVEGMAEYLSIGPVDPNTSMWLRDAALTGDVPTVEQMTRDSRYFPYRWGQAFWSYVGGRWGDAAIGQILKQAGQGVPYPEAFQRILNTSLDEISLDWQTSIRRTYLPLLTTEKEAREVATPLITQKRKGGRYNVSPSLSPDGTRLAFLSSLSNFDVQLYLANAQTGEVIRTLVKGTAFDPHYSSLNFISSSGTWSPDAARFAFSARRGASDVLVVIDTRTGRKEREYRLREVSEITNPAWSPDGRTLMFSGKKGGITDLYALDLASGASRQVTNDKYADMQPEYSPDGSTIAFVTDRGPGTDLAALRYGGYQVALMDVATGAIRMAPGMAGPKNINPVWTRDGRGLYFVSNRTGIPNLYRVNLASGEVFKLTDLFSGVSGITDLSPVITSARTTDRVLITAFEKNGYNIYSITDPVRLAGRPAPPAQLASWDVSPPIAAVLPPSPRPTEPAFNRVLALVRNQDIGLATAQQASGWITEAYRPRLGLDYLGQPQLGVSTGSGYYGSGGLYGGISGIFSDILGRHTIYGTIQAQGSIDEIGFSTVYINQRQRWNYGVAVQRVPYIAGVAYTREVNAAGEFLDQQRIYRIFDNRVGGIAQYPFSRVQRLEFSGGLRHIGQDQRIQEYVYATQPDADGNPQVVGGPFDYRERKESGKSYNLAEASAALIYDNSLSGYTSPFAGQRYHFEIAPTVGTGRFVEATADYRRYQFIRPVTLAFRALHFGRYGRDERLFGDQFLGYSYFMRGYDYNSVSNGCNTELQGGSSTGADCSLLNALFGSRIGVTNVELRVPLLARLIGQSGLSPLEGVVFYDAGVAWGKTTDSFGQEITTSPVLKRGLQSSLADRGILTSAGVGARLNLFGYAVVEADYVKAFERGDNKPRWQFSFQPGF